ncbi:MAG: hypothetical protein LBS55_10505 [Prevotellaceae bacterium]|jgi:uncharacterized protein (TIGR02001 family)|nr:hypothetical protein [Prevotellaceae bacterium]
MKNINYISIKIWVVGITLLSTVVLSTVPASGQDAVETSAGVDLVSKYVWRGVDQGYGTSLQPALGLSYKGFSLGAWGSVSFANPDPYELDFSLGYSVGGFSIGITDYYWNGIEGSFFNHIASNHLLEGNLAFSFGEKLPLTLSWNTFFAGRSDQDEDGEQLFSTYVEAAYDFSLGGLDFTASVGAAPWDSPAWLNPTIGKTGFRISSISLSGTKKLEITPTFSVPLFVQCIFSPATDASHLVVGFSF